jgi:16S rRNA processing protein RimM
MADPASTEGFVTLARVLKTQGRRGEVAVEAFADPGRFTAGLKLLALSENGERRDLSLVEAWPHKGHVVLRFGGIDSISDAEQLIGCQLQVLQSERPPLEQGWTYVGDLVGCTVFDGDREIGAVEDVQAGAGEAPLLILRAGNREISLPFADAYLREVHIAAKRITMALPEGMLELDAPLTAEEKAQQHKRSK